MLRSFHDNYNYVLIYVLGSCDLQQQDVNGGLLGAFVAAGIICIILTIVSHNTIICCIDNHSSGYLGMAVEHCVRANLSPNCILAQKQYCQKLMAQLNSTAFFYLCICNLKL